MNSNERLTHFLRLALEKVSRKEFKKPSDALIQSLPSIIETCTELAKAGTPPERKQALELIGMFWNRLLKDEASRRTLASKRKPKPKVPKSEPMSSEDFASRLTGISDEDADRFHRVMQKAFERWQAKYHGIGG